MRARSQRVSGRRINQIENQTRPHALKKCGGKYPHSAKQVRQPTSEK